MSYYAQIEDIKRQNADLAQQVVEMARKSGADEVRVVISSGKGVEADARHGDVESLEFYQDKSLALNIYKDHRLGSVRTSDMSTDALQNAIDSALSLASFASQDEFAGLCDKNDLYAPQNEDSENLEILYELIEDADYAVENAIKLDKLGIDKVKEDAKKGLKDSDGASFSTFYTMRTVANSHGFVGTSVESEISKYLTLCGEQDETMQRASGYSIARKHEDILSDEIVLNEAVSLTLDKLGAKQVPTNTYPIILSKSAAQSFIGHFMQAIMGSLIYRSASFLKDKIGEQIFPHFINIKEDPFVKGGWSSALFDVDGVRARANHYILDGILKEYLTGAYSSRKLKVANNGHNDTSYNWFVYADDEHTKSIDNILKEVGTGLVINSLMGQGVDIVSGNYSRGASGYYFENGERCHAVEEITIAGNLKDMFASISMLGNDIDKRRRIHMGSIVLPGITVSGS